MSEKVVPLFSGCNKSVCFIPPPPPRRVNYLDFATQEEKTEGRGRRKRKLSTHTVPAVTESGTVF